MRDDELRLNILAGIRWSEKRDLPDIVGWRDVAFAPSETIGVIRARLAGCLGPATTHSIPLPKRNSDESRQYSICDPFDEIVFRTLVGSVSSRIDAAMGPEVTSYRLKTPGLGWETSDHGYDDVHRRHDVATRIAAASFGGLGMLDVRRYYPSLSSTLVHDVLLSLGSNPHDVARITTYLDAWRAWGINGVPIGPEASGLLGNACLVSVDNMLRSLGVPFSRHTDDYRIWLWSPSDWAYVRDAVVSVLGALGLEVNPRKTMHVETPHGVRRQLMRPELDHLKAALDDDSIRGMHLARDMLDAQLDRPRPDGRTLKFLLGVFRNKRDVYASHLAMTTPGALRAEPGAWGAYLKVLNAHAKIDVDWLASVALARPAPETAALAYGLLDALRARGLNKAIGMSLGEFAQDGSSYVPLRSMAADAWAVSEGWKPGKAASAALGAGDAQHRRALVLSLRRWEQSRSRDRAFKKLRAVSLEVRPAIRWIEEEGPIAA